MTSEEEVLKFLKDNIINDIPVRNLFELINKQSNGSINFKQKIIKELE